MDVKYQSQDSNLGQLIPKSVNSLLDPTAFPDSILFKGIFNSLAFSSQLPMRGMNKSVITANMPFCDSRSSVPSSWPGQDGLKGKKRKKKVKYRPS